jgi:glycosyltransferase involved in cell wall biosynthesis
MQTFNCSIVIPTRNCLNYLPTTLATIELQGRDDLEIVIADDGSTDGTAEWLAGRHFGKMRLIYLQTGGIGPAAASIALLRAAPAIKRLRRHHPILLRFSMLMISGWLANWGRRSLFIACTRRWGCRSLITCM